MTLEEAGNGKIKKHKNKYYTEKDLMIGVDVIADPPYHTGALASYNTDVYRGSWNS